MKYLIETSIAIQAPIEQVWKSFRDFKSHKHWNTFLRIHEFDKDTTQRLRVDFISGEKVKMTMRPILLKDETECAFEWMGHLIIKGLFDGHHQFHFRKIDNTTTEMIQREAFSGLLIKWFRKSILKPTEKQFQLMNSAFKKYVESQVIQ